MADLIDVDWHPGPSKLRNFGFLLAAFSAAVAGGAAGEFGWFAGVPEGVRTLVMALSGGVGLFSLVASAAFPKANRPTWVVATLVALPIGFVLSYVLLFALFFLVFVPVRAVLWTLRVDPMHKRAEPGRKSYWVESRGERSRASYFRQF